MPNWVTLELKERPRPGEVIMLPNGEKVRVKHVGIPWLLPPRAVCNDPRCPWHGHVKVRGEVIEGRVVSVYMGQVVVLHEWLHYVPKYKRYERRRRKIHAHLPPCISVKEGDVVIIGETRPLAKFISFVVLGKRPDDVASVKPEVVGNPGGVAEPASTSGQ